jgi:arylformamidase
MDSSVVTRRAMLGGAAIVAAAPAVAQECRIGPVPHAKGPPVFMDYDQVELDAAYNQLVYAPTTPQIVKRYVTNSDATRARLGPPKRFAYGPTAVEGLDVYRSSRENAPIMVFVHGGEWRAGSAKASAYAAELFVRSGAHFVVPDFINVIEAGGSLMPMADQVRRAVKWVHDHANEFGGDANRIFLSGHSSGGHLTGVLVTTDWAKDFGLPADVIKGAIACSGMYELAPVALSFRRTFVTFTPQTIEALSPQRHLDKIVCPTIVTYGTLETPEFQRHSRDFAAAAAAAGKPVSLLACENYNHFEIIETMANPYGPLGRAALEMMSLAPV